jgi:hypothetical protein
LCDKTTPELDLSTTTSTSHPPAPYQGAYQKAGCAGLRTRLTATAHLWYNQRLAMRCDGLGCSRHCAQEGCTNVTYHQRLLVRTLQAPTAPVRFLGFSYNFWAFSGSPFDVQMCPSGSLDRSTSSTSSTAPDSDSKLLRIKSDTIRYKSED